MKKIDFNREWFYSTENREKEKITLPHDAQLLDGRRADSPGGGGHGYYVGNVYFYEKKFDVPAEWKEKHVEILFEGAYRNTKVTLNGEQLGEHKYGYTGFTFSMDEHLKYGEENVLEVIVDNSKLPNSRWYSGGGIYRPVSLWIGEKEHIKYEGVRVTTLSVDPAKVLVETEATGDDIEIEIIKDDVVVAKGRGVSSEIEIPNALLWSADTPNLYTARVTLKKDGELKDEMSETFGIRSLSWSPKGFFVNGENTLLKGGCVHHDNGIVGAASYKESEWRRVRILKENGFNAIRVSHNPASTAMLEACDFYGMYVMDETFDMWYVRKTKYDYGLDFRDNWKSDVATMVRRDYNHPSVIMYSIGNEVSEPGKPEGVKQGKEIISFIKEMDNSRVVTGGMNLMIMSNFAKGKGQYDNVDKEENQNGKEEVSDAKNGSLLFNTIATFMGPSMNKAGNSKKVDVLTTPILDALDIAGYNYANGRYPLEEKAHPNRIVVGSETFPYEIGKNWDMVEKYPYLIGDFMWTAWDYMGEAGLGAWSYTGGMPFNRPYPWKLGGAGVIDILGNPDSSCDYAKVVWRETENPVIGVRPVNHPGVRVSKSIWRGTNAIPSWSWKDCDGNKAEIDVFARADSVELLVNGTSLGKKKIKNYQALFKTKYEPGTLEAVAFDASGKEIGRSSLSSAKESKVCILPEKERYTAGEVAYVNISIQDENGIVESNADRKLSVEVEGGELLGFGSANPCTKEEFTDGSYTTYFGRAQAVVRIGEHGTAKIKVQDGANVIEQTL